MHPFRKLYQQEYDFPRREEGPSFSYFLAAIPRTGSTLLSLKIWQKAALGAPLEYLNIADRRDDIRRFGNNNLYAYWENIKRRRTSPQGVFGSKLFPSDIRHLFGADPDALNLIEADAVIRVERRDIISQAISYNRAMQSKIWIVGDPSAVSGEVSYSFDSIADNIRLIKRQIKSWSDIMRVTGARYITVYYEDFEDDANHEVGRIAEFLGFSITDSNTIPLPSISKQRDITSNHWHDKFSEELFKRGLSISEI